MSNSFKQNKELDGVIFIFQFFLILFINLLLLLFLGFNQNLELWLQYDTGS